MPGIPNRICCFSLDGMVNTQVKVLEVAASLTEEDGGATLSGDAVAP